jgi:hypothetical protein
MVLFQLKIEQFWPFEEISIFSNGGHLGYRTALTDTNLKGTHPGTTVKLLSQSQPNFTEMILGWSPSKIMSGISVLRPRRPLQPNLNKSLVAICPVVSEEKIFM